MDTTKRIFTGALVGSALLGGAPWAWSQAWPTRTVKLVIPFGAGGTSDIVARMVAQELSQRWGQQVIVENKPGGDTSIAASEVQRAAPDGYTLLMTINSTLTLTPHTMAKVPYHYANDFTYVGQLTEVPLIMMSSEAVPAKTLAEFVDYAKARPGQINASGAAALTQVLTEQFSRAAGIKMTWVMYKSGGEITRALLSNEVHFGIDAVANNLQHIQSGKIRALAVNTPTRISSLPDVPTLRELNFREPMIALQHLVLAPKGLPPALLAKIQGDVQAAITTAALRDKLLANGVLSSWRDGADVLKSIQAENAATPDLVRSLGLKAQ